MCEFLPYMTNDYSVGLYDNEVNDIYHSAFGALTEAYEKFGKSVFFKFISGANLKILDICYGIGYNSKVLINEAIKKDVSINIDCIDTNNLLMELSPFIKTKVSFYDRYLNKKILTKNVTDYDEANKIIKLNNVSSIYKISKAVNYIIFKNLYLDKQNKLSISENAMKILTDIEYSPFFDKDLIKFIKFLLKNRVYLYQNKNKMPFVHNIYYRYISQRYIYRLNKQKLSNIKLNFHPLDIRQFIKSSDLRYDIILLDGFTPSKCPCIWTVEMFNELYRCINDDGLLVTYNTSAPVRNAMILSGFVVGNIIKDNKIIGTICSKSNELINFKLSDKQLGLLNTKAGIPYRDVNLSLDNDIIIKNRRDEVLKSPLISSSKYLKEHKDEI